VYVAATLMGRLAADAELKFTNDGTPVASFTVMTSRRFNNPNTGKWEDRDVTGWRCAAFGDFAENLAAQFMKGDAVIVYGQLSESTWEDRDGGKRSRIEMRVDAAGHDFRWGVPGASSQ